MIRRPPRSTLFPSTTLSRSSRRTPKGARSGQANFGVALERPFAVDLLDQSLHLAQAGVDLGAQRAQVRGRVLGVARHRLGVDRKSTRLNSSHLVISYAVFRL